MENRIPATSVPVLYTDSCLLIVNKPRGVHVHATRLSRGEVPVQQLLEEQESVPLFPVHRLDRPVGGVLVFARNSETAGVLGEAFRQGGVIHKRYLALVRGWMDNSGAMDRPLRQEKGKPERPALTIWHTLSRVSAPWSDGVHIYNKSPESRYSLVECIPRTGRRHQIRRHLSGVSHPVLGDIQHGDNPVNRIWKTQSGLDGLFLYAMSIGFTHPESGEKLQVSAPPDPRFVSAARLLGIEDSLVIP